MVSQLRTLPAPEGVGVANAKGGRIFDSRLPSKLFWGPFPTRRDFHKELANGIDPDTKHEDTPPDFQELLDFYRQADEKPVFTHGDLSSLNVLVRGDEVWNHRLGDVRVAPFVLGVHVGVVGQSPDPILAAGGGQVSHANAGRVACGRHPSQIFRRILNSIIQVLHGLKCTCTMNASSALVPCGLALFCRHTKAANRPASPLFRVHYHVSMFRRCSSLD